MHCKKEKSLTSSQSIYIQYTLLTLQSVIGEAARELNLEKPIKKPEVGK